MGGEVDVRNDNRNIQYVSSRFLQLLPSLMFLPAAYIVGFVFRFVLHTHPDSKGAYIVEYLFIVLSVRSHIYTYTSGC